MNRRGQKGTKFKMSLDLFIEHKTAHNGLGQAIKYITQKKYMVDKYITKY